MTDKYYSFETIKDTIMNWIGEQTVSKYPTFAECKAARMGAEGIIYALEDVPAADVVEVVRCKDCKYAERYKCQVDPCYTRLSCKRRDYYSEGVDELDFCSYGERKEKMKIINCPNCGTEMISESVGWKCPDCKGFISMDGVFHEYKETRFMPPKTNYDVITSKSVERLAEFLIWICHEPIFSDFTKEDWIEELSKEVD